MGERYAVTHSDFYEQVKERLIRYAKINTQSRPLSTVSPSTSCQKDLACELYKELCLLGLDSVYYDASACVVYAKIPSTLSSKKHAEPFGLIAHIDTAPDASGEHVKPWVLEQYDGSDIVLNKEQSIVMLASDYPNLNRYIGQDLILTDGTTLLGGDDKASIAAIMTMAEYLMAHPEIPHGTICLAFTPDEEVGGLAKDLDLNRFGAKVAYTLDGDHLGYYEDETFNASEAIIEIEGLSVHTGTAKGIMKNAVDIASMFLSSLPPSKKPQYTSGTEGFFHVISCNATCEHARIELIIRDFDQDRFAARENLIRSIAEKLDRQFGGVSVRIIEQYRNMHEVLDTVPYLIDRLRTAISDCGITPVSEPFRGGTDGAALSFRGLPCPNLSAGYENAHGRFEYVPIQSMEKNVQILLRLCELFIEE